MEARKKILIVDDEQINLEFFDVMLSKLGFTVEKAENGVEALEKVRRFSPDLIILDNIMPKMSGWEVTKNLKNSEEYSDFRETPIIMFSAMDDVKDKVEGFELGVDDYITKPYNFSEVLARIRAVLRNRELFAQIAARESRIAIAENLNEDILDFGAFFIQNFQDVVAEAKKIRDNPATAKFASLFLEKSDEVMKRIHAFEERMEFAAVERERIKKMEIELKILEKQFRKGLQQE
ncbi:MAG: response regulator receiver protein [Treponema sp. GWB1_62_6]|nr:MAG: response regulator receiver protein [Treponema sp. GWA1_62_8]OHE64965.1 MAG: response regulator receiver protein [Treponema sp. GWB1_62_6]OHE67053.1 MAG: response regulator receiver protein [Treponema sp. GWC1_61_84]OHE70945.1 MAG: response regulator receiver protein [Treponema sp. RIFOXYC1_FULL_61_9]HCM27363.1 response regulator [Treponema sp.]